MTTQDARRPLGLYVSVGELAKRSGVAVSAIHFYETKGLLQSLRTAGNQRRYTRATLRRLAVIRVAQRAGLPLATIKSYLDVIPSDREISAADWLALSASWKAELELRIDSLTQLRDQLMTCIGCGCLSTPDCPLFNKNDRLSVEGPGPRLLMTDSTPA